MKVQWTNKSFFTVCQNLYFLLSITLLFYLISIFSLFSYLSFLSSNGRIVTFYFNFYLKRDVRDRLISPSEGLSDSGPRLRYIRFLRLVGMGTKSNCLILIISITYLCWWAVVNEQKSNTMTIAKLNISVLWSYLFEFACSGDEKSLVPTLLLKVSSWINGRSWLGSLYSIEDFQYFAFRERPKSIILHLPSEITALWSLISLWRILFEWRYDRPFVRSNAIL